MKNAKRKYTSVAAAIVSTFIMFSSSANAVIIAITATEDSIILDGSNSNNLFPGILASELDTSGSGSIWLSVLKFNLSALTGLTVNSASFELTSHFNHSTATFAHEVFSSSDDSWTEGTVTGVNRPSDATLTLLDSSGISGTSQTYTWDVLSGVLGADGLAGANNFLTLLVRPELSQAGSGGFGPHFNDREDLSGFPVLLMDASDVNPVPIPGVVWLFISGLIILFSFRETKSAV